MKKLKFYLFLFNNRALQAFRLNNESESLVGDYSEWLVISFEWEKTPEGFEYWNNLDNLWEAKCKNDL